MFDFLLDAIANYFGLYDSKRGLQWTIVTLIAFAVALVVFILLIGR